VLELSGSLEVTVGDEHITIVADRQQLTARVTGTRHLRRALTVLTTRRPMIRTLAAGLHARGLTLTIERNGSPLAQLGADTTASALARVLDIPHLALFPRRRQT
jgi:hypothetical protein